MNAQNPKLKTVKFKVAQTERQGSLTQKISKTQTLSASQQTKYQSLDR